MTITLDDMVKLGKVVPIDVAVAKLSQTEPISSVVFSTGDKVAFDVKPTWNHGLAAIGGTELVDAFVMLDDVEYQLSKDALLEATSLCGLPKGYTARCPSDLVNEALNYWYRQGMEKEIKMLEVAGAGAAFTRGTIVPFSNLRLVEQAVDGIHAKFGSHVPIYADVKMHHSLRKTHLRLIVPSESVVIKSHRHTAANPDQWSVGVALQNSLVGEEMTQIDGYAFAWLCTNGMIDQRHGSGAWSRRSGGQGEDVYAWARLAVDEVLGGLEHTLDEVASLTQVKLEGTEAEVSETLRDIFGTYSVPVSARGGIIENMVDSDDLSMYGVLNAITQVANTPDLPAEQVDALLRIGGEVSASASARCPECHRIAVA